MRTTLNPFASCGFGPMPDIKFVPAIPVVVNCVLVYTIVLNPETVILPTPGVVVVHDGAFDQVVNVAVPLANIVLSGPAGIIK